MCILNENPAFTQKHRSIHRKRKPQNDSWGVILIISSRAMMHDVDDETSDLCMCMMLEYRNLSHVYDAGVYYMYDVVHIPRTSKIRSCSGFRIIMHDVACCISYAYLSFLMCSSIMMNEIRHIGIISAIMHDVSHHAWCHSSCIMSCIMYDECQSSMVIYLKCLNDVIMDDDIHHGWWHSSWMMAFIMHDDIHHAWCLSSWKISGGISRESGGNPREKGGITRS